MTGADPWEGTRFSKQIIFLRLGSELRRKNCLYSLDAYSQKHDVSHEFGVTANK